MKRLQTTSVLIVDDNMIDSSWLKQTLETMGYKTLFIAYTLDVAANIIVDQKPRIIICDLFFDGKPEGITLLNQFASIGKQFIMTTSSDEHFFYEQTQAVGVGGHLIKPFHPLTLRSVLDQLITVTLSPDSSRTAHLFIRGAQNKQIRVELSDILFLYSERNYTFIKTTQGRYTIKRSLSKMQEELDHRFLRIHNSYIINIDFLKSMSASMVLIDKDIIPLGRAYRKNLTAKLKPA